MSHLAIRDGESGRLTVPGIFSVIPAKAGIHPAKRGTGPQIKPRSDGVIPANRTIFLVIAIYQVIRNEYKCRQPSRRGVFGLAAM